MSQERCAALALETKELPLTEKGRLLSPDSVTAGAAIPPRAFDVAPPLPDPEELPLPFPPDPSLLPLEASPLSVGTAAEGATVEVVADATDLLATSASS